MKHDGEALHYASGAIMRAVRPLPTIRSADVFCAVVDNYGDAGFCWRLARILASDHRLAVRLWIDVPQTLARLAPDYDPLLETARVDGVVIKHWRRRAPMTESIALPHLVVEAFGCGLDDAYVDAMAGADRPPVWINVEHLSAEAWVEGFHGLPSPQPRGTLTRHFFFPGFDARTGGLLRERSLLDRRDAFRRDPAHARRLFAELAPTGLSDGAMTLSLFGYAHPRLPGLLDAWSAADRAIVCLVPKGSMASEIGAWSRGRALAAAESLQCGTLRLVSIPFTDQDAYDRLLWACDLNFVRGEDSFVRAQWAGRPMVWQAYRQDADAQAAKVSAFCARYVRAMDEPAAGAYRAFLMAWNGSADLAPHWAALARQQANLEAHAARWSEHCATLPELSAALVNFARQRV